MQLFRAKARRTMRHNRKQSWKNYVSKLNNRTPIKQVWETVRKITGKNADGNIQHLKTTEDNQVTGQKEISDTLASSFEKNSSYENSSESFLREKEIAEKEPLNFKSNNKEKYNKRFKFRELRKSIKHAKDSAAGPDEIHYQLLKHLPDETLKILLKILNQISNKVETCHHYPTTQTNEGSHKSRQLPPHCFD